MTDRPVQTREDAPMSLQRMRTWFAGNFAVQTYLYLVACVVCATVLLSGLLIHFQQEMLRRNILETGNTVVSFLTENLRLGVFAENGDEIRAAILPVLHDSHVEVVAVFSPKGKLLESARTAWAAGHLPSAWVPVPPASLLEDLKGSGGPVHREDDDRITFWKSLRAEPGQSAADELYFKDPLATKAPAQLLGFVAVAVSKEQLRTGVRAVVVRSAAVGLVFLVLGSLAAYLVVRGASRPLHRLVEDVRRRGIPTSRGDDLGALSDTFSQLIETLDRSFATIDELRLGLEKKVEERTTDLRRSNTELQIEIRERERIQKELKQAGDELEQRVRERTADLETAHKQLLHSEKLSALGTLTASIAHELNNPLGSILGVLELIQSRVAMRADDAKLTHVAIQECYRISRLINGLRGFYRPSSDTIAPMDLNEAVDAVLLLCRKEYMARGIRLETHYAKEVPRVPAVADQIKQVILNLLNNARDATEKGGAVQISTEVDGDRVTLRIEDTGKGIEQADIEHLFEPFFSTKAASGGTGLGLSISHGIIKRHGGDIHVVSEVGQGTRFTVSLPTQGPPAEAEIEGES